MTDPTSIEREFLCNVLNSPDALQDREALLLDGADFADDTHRRIYSCARALVDGGAKVDLISVREVLKERSELDLCGGDPFLSSLVDEAGVRPIAFAQAARIRDARKRRMDLE